MTDFSITAGGIGAAFQITVHVNSDEPVTSAITDGLVNFATDLASTVGAEDLQIFRTDEVVTDLTPV